MDCFSQLFSGFASGTENFRRALRFTSSLWVACIGLASYAPRKSLRTFAENFLMCLQRNHKIVALDATLEINDAIPLTIDLERRASLNQSPQKSLQKYF